MLIFMLMPPIFLQEQYIQVDFPNTILSLHNLDSPNILCFLMVIITLLVPHSLELCEQPLSLQRYERVNIRLHIFCTKIFGQLHSLGNLWFYNEEDWREFQLENANIDNPGNVHNCPSFHLHLDMGISQGNSKTCEVGGGSPAICERNYIQTTHGAFNSLVDKKRSCNSTTWKLHEVIIL